jgi:5-hydroxyisourate hydrolase
MRIVAQVLDGTYGKPAVGVRARLARASGDDWTTVAEAETSGDGRIEDWDSLHLERGLYRIVFDSDSYFSGLGVTTAYPEVSVIFRTEDQYAAFQVQVILAPYSYSTYFGTTGGSVWAPLTAAPRARNVSVWMVPAGGRRCDEEVRSR